MQKKLFWETLEILKFIHVKKDMSAEDDIFLAEASPIADRRKLPYRMCTILNKISITMCDVSKGGGGGGLQRNEHMTFLMDKIDMWGFPYIVAQSTPLSDVEQACMYDMRRIYGGIPYHAFRHVYNWDYYSTPK